MLHEFWKINTPTRRHFGGGYFDLLVWYGGRQGSPGSVAAGPAATGPLPLGPSSSGLSASPESRIDYGKRRILGFQLGYGVEWSGGNSLTYLKGRYSHSAIEEKKRTASPILKATGGFDKERVAARFVMEAAEIDPAVRDFVLERIEAYREEDDAGEWIFPPGEGEGGY
jgi:hypothetical protein